MVRKSGTGHPRDEIFKLVIRRARAANVPFAVGGFHGLAAYTRQKRISKDLDLYVVPDDRGRMIEVVTGAGLVDYYDTMPYDRNWIYRSTRNSVIVDVIWGMANYRAQVDDVWLTAGREINFLGERVRVLPPEENLWARLYVLQRDRCDWPDVMNLLASVGPALNWAHLFDRLEDDYPLLGAALAAFAWLDPSRASRLPAKVWERVGLPKPKRPSASPERPRPRLLDGRNWYVGRTA